MTREEKQILLQDLCMRLPYKVKCFCKWTKEAPNGTVGCIQEISTFLLDEFEIMDKPEYSCQISEVKPYLRPMSSMTAQEKKDLLAYVVGEEASEYFVVCDDGSIRDKNPDVQDGKSFKREWINFDTNTTLRYIDWLNARHFDYRGLIEKGLALEATEEMYKLKR